MSWKNTAALAAAAIGGTLVLGQAPELQGVADLIRDDQQALLQYSWKSRVQIALDDEPFSSELFQVRPGRNGRLQRTPVELRPPRPLGDPVEGGGEAGGGIGTADLPDEPGPTPEPEAETGPVGPAEPTDEQLLAARIEQLRLLATTYRPEPRLIQSLLTDGSVREGQGDGENAGLMRVEAWDVRQVGDSVGLWLDSDSKAPRRYEATTLVDETPVQIVIEFTRLPTGPIYASRTAIEAEVSGQKLRILTETFDYVRR